GRTGGRTDNDLPAPVIRGPAPPSARRSRSYGATVTFTPHGRSNQPLLRRAPASQGQWKALLTPRSVSRVKKCPFSHALFRKVLTQETNLGVDAPRRGDQQDGRRTT